MLHKATSHRLLTLIVGAAFALTFAGSALAESRVVFQASKDDVKNACDKLGDSGVDVAGKDGKGYGCYNEKTGVLVACSEGGTCTGYLPRTGAPGKKTLGGILNFGIKVAPSETEGRSPGSSEGGGTGGSDDGGGGCGAGCIP